MLISLVWQSLSYQLYMSHKHNELRALLPFSPFRFYQQCMDVYLKRLFVWTVCYIFGQWHIFFSHFYIFWKQAAIVEQTVVVTLCFNTMTAAVFIGLSAFIADSGDWLRHSMILYLFTFKQVMRSVEVIFVKKRMTLVTIKTGPPN